jgi:hypothetical protein
MKSLTPLSSDESLNKAAIPTRGVYNVNTEYKPWIVLSINSPLSIFVRLHSYGIVT